MQDMKNDNEIEINLEELVGLILHRLWLKIGRAHV